MTTTLNRGRNYPVQGLNRYDIEEKLLDMIRELKGRVIPRDLNLFSYLNERNGTSYRT